MGLGPPVCERCIVRAYLDANAGIWYCKYCGNKNTKWNAWDCDFSEDELTGNELFLKFVKGEDDASTSR